MIIVRASGFLFDEQIRYPAWEATNNQLRHWLETLNLGGVILLGGSAAELALKAQMLQKWAKIPLFIAADIEEGVGQRFPGATRFPPPMALGDIARNHLSLGLDYAQQMGSITAQEALSIGINWILAPVVDVNNNPDNPVINIRAFSDNPEIVAHLSQAFIKGAQAFPVLTTAKHFPGHGDTSTDSHLDLPIIPHTKERLESLELLPFQAAISSGVDSIMTAHLSIPAWDKDYPATLSKTILTEQLRQNLGFEGLIITDALIMGGITKFTEPEEVAVRAIEAGADILLMPTNPVVAIEAIYRAVQTGRLTESRIRDSLGRIARAKEKFLAKDGDSFLSQLSQPQAIQLVKDILKASLKCSGSLPIKPLQNARNLIIVDDLLNCDFLDRQSASVTIPKELGYQLELMDQTTLANFKADKPTLLQIFIRGNPFRGSAGLNDLVKSIYHNLLESKQLQALVIYGSPYVLDWVNGMDLPWVFSYGQMPTAQELALKTLFGISQGTLNESDVFIDN